MEEADGKFTADPRKVPTARLLPLFSLSEAAELTYFGSKVIHPHTMEQVVQAKIPIRIKNVNNPQGTGTVIVPDSPNVQDTITSRDSQFTLADLNVSKVPKRPTTVTVKRSVIIPNLCSNKTIRAHGFLSRIFQILDTHYLSVDLIASSEIHISLALDSEHPISSGVCISHGTDKDSSVSANERLRRACNDLKDLGAANVDTDMAILSLVGQKLRAMIGISGKFFRVLGENDINIEMISKGARLRFRGIKSTQS